MTKILTTISVLINYIILYYNRVQIGSNIRIRGFFSLKKAPGTNVTIGSDFTLLSGNMYNAIGRNIKSCLRIDKGAELKIGDNCGFSCVTIWAKKGIHIGNNVKIGADSILIDSDMHSLDYLQRRDISTDSANARSAMIVLEDDVFIGTRCIITKGVVIGRKSIIAAGSVVSKSVPENEIWGGNPARFLKKIY